MCLKKKILSSVMLCAATTVLLVSNVFAGNYIYPSYGSGYGDVTSWLNVTRSGNGQYISADIGSNSGKTVKVKLYAGTQTIDSGSFRARYSSTPNLFVNTSSSVRVAVDVYTNGSSTPDDYSEIYDSTSFMN